MTILTGSQKADIDAKDPAPNVRVAGKGGPLMEAAARYEANSPRMTNVGRAALGDGYEDEAIPELGRDASIPSGDKTFENETRPTPPDLSELPEDPKKAWGDKKIPVGLVNPLLILEEAQQMRIGDYKYGAYNYVGKPLPAMTYVNAMLRHFLLWAGGENNDPESGRSHLTAIRACCGILRTQQMAGNMVDDHPDWGDVRALIEELDLNWEEITPLLDKQIEGMKR